MNQKSKIVEELTDEIADLILESKKLSALKTKDEIQKKDLTKIVKLEERMATVESKLKKCVDNFKIVATESERLVTEKVENVNKETNQRITNLQTQISDLEIVVTKLGDEIKKMKEVLGLPR